MGAAMVADAIHVAERGSLPLAGNRASSCTESCQNRPASAGLFICGGPYASSADGSSLLCFPAGSGV